MAKFHVPAPISAPLNKEVNEKVPKAELLRGIVSDTARPVPPTTSKSLKRGRIII
jgi:hypothetical protein